MLLLTCQHAYADGPKPVIDIVNMNSFDNLQQSRESIAAKMQTCESDRTGAVTVYAITEKAQAGIAVSIDASPVGDLTTYFPELGPACLAAGSRGVITLVLSTGEHSLKASSLNLDWPDVMFSINTCECVRVPLAY